jgi:hypothetical protein
VNGDADVRDNGQISLMMNTIASTFVSFGEVFGYYQIPGSNN